MEGKRKNEKKIKLNALRTRGFSWLFLPSESFVTDETFVGKYVLALAIDSLLVAILWDFWIISRRNITFGAPLESPIFINVFLLFDCTFIDNLIIHTLPILDWLNNQTQFFVFKKLLLCFFLVDLKMWPIYSSAKETSGNRLQSFLVMAQKSSHAYNDRSF